MDDRQRQLRDEFVDACGFWNSALQSLLELDAGFFEAYLRLTACPRRGGQLEPKVREFISIAVDGAATHLHEPGLRQHIRNALAHGASKEELTEVLELTSTLGIHACNIGVPLLLEAANGRGGTQSPLTERQLELKASFEAKRGYWHPFWDGLLELDPDFFEAYLGFSGHPWTHGVLEPKVKELIYVAFDVSATHLYVPGLKLHIENALGLGATKEELMEVFELASTIGIQTCTVGVPILLEELERAAVEAKS
jgi:alkylhydroperoxidase/carboxymuconolactone decarboxylase family protein YurZ